jgi:hypothetical protein
MGGHNARKRMRRSNSGSFDHPLGVRRRCRREQRGLLADAGMGHLLDEPDVLQQRRTARPYRLDVDVYPTEARAS